MRGVQRTGEIAGLPDVPAAALAQVEMAGEIGVGSTQGERHGVGTLRYRDYVKVIGHAAVGPYAKFGFLAVATQKVKIKGQLRV